MILPTTRQIQLIADLLAGRALTLPPETVAGLTDPWNQYYRKIQAYLQHDPDRPEYYVDWFTHYLAQRDQNELNNLPLILHAIDTPISYPSADQTLAAIGDLRWLWKGWLLRGLPSLLAAVPGTGKSYLALDLAHRIIAGSNYPDGQPIQTPGRVLFVDAENTPSIHKERLTVWPTSAVQRLYLMLPAPQRLVINLDDFADRDRLADMAWAVHPTLIIIDSYGSCTLKGENNKEDVQVLLAYFNQLAKDYDCGLLVIHHLRKGANAAPGAFTPMTIDAIRGSSHIAAMARHIWGLQFVPSGPHPGANDPRRLWIMKSNVGAAPEPIGITFGPHPSNPDVAQLTYGESPEPYKENSKLEQCATWILSQLQAAGQPIKPADLIDTAKQDGYYSSLIYRARQTLDDLIVDTEQKRHHPHNAWALAEWIRNDDPDTLH